MGKTKLKLMDDSIQEEEKKEKPSKKKIREETEAKLESAKASGQVEQSKEETKSSESETTGAVESAPEVETVEATDSQQTRSEGSGRPSDVSTTDESTPSKKPKKPGKAKPRSKKYQEISKDLDRSKYYPVGEAVEMLKKLSYTKFNATIEAHINTHALGLRGFVSLPYASGKKIRILAFGKGAEDSGADLVGSDEIIEEINKGKINFDLLITTSEWMPKLAKVARILGPRSLMPNPKSGTITEDLKKAVESFAAGKTEYKTEPKAPIIHMPLGKLNQPNEELTANIKTLLMNVGKSRIKKVSLSPTMGPSVKLDLTSI